MYLSLWRCGFIVGCVLLCTSCMHVGQRLLHIEVEVDGQIVCDGIRGVRDDMPVNEMWNVLDSMSFESTGVIPAPATGDEWQLQGDVVVRIKHVDHELARSALSALSLTRNASGSGWSVDAAEVERIQSAYAP